MKISDLIKQLQHIEGEFGDIEVRFIGTLSETDADDSIPIAGIAIHCDEADDPIYALISDDLTLDALANPEY